MKIILCQAKYAKYDNEVVMPDHNLWSVAFSDIHLYCAYLAEQGVINYTLYKWLKTFVYFPAIQSR